MNDEEGVRRGKAAVGEPDTLKRSSQGGRGRTGSEFERAFKFEKIARKKKKKR